MLPNFIGIGAPRCGSTWLHDLLQSHPDIYMPLHRKELYYFNTHYDRGLGWYEKFFPTDDERDRWRAVGEITPVYMYDPEVPRRLREFEHTTRLIAILRHPADRLYSQYVKRRLLGKTTLGFRDFVTDDPIRIKLGCYSEYITPFLEHFDRSQILVLVMEDSVSNVDGTKAVLADFLGVEASRFPSEAGHAASNAGSTPERRPVYLAAHAVARKLRGHDMDWVVTLGHKLGLKQSLLGRGRKYPPLSAEDRDWLTGHYAAEFESLESRLGLDVSAWRAPRSES